MMKKLLLLFALILLVSAPGADAQGRTSRKDRNAGKSVYVRADDVLFFDAESKPQHYTVWHGVRKSGYLSEKSTESDYRYSGTKNGADIQIENKIRNKAQKDGFNAVIVISKERVVDGVTGKNSIYRIWTYIPILYDPDENRPPVEDTLRMWAGNIHQFNSIFPQEKVYLEFDNSAYFQGENIWFKAFVTHASTLQRAPSKVLYVDLIAPDGYICESLKLKVVAGQADGVFSLIDPSTSQARQQRGMLNYPSGFYEIRAYTQNQLDFPKEALFSRILPVYTKPRHDGEYNKSEVRHDTDSRNKEYFSVREETDVQKRDIEVSFYPEGGDIVQGLPCNVAFKATGPDGLGLDGQLILGDGSDTVYTVHDGMGSITFTRDRRSGAQAQFVSWDGESRRVTLPRAVRSGYSMIVSERTDSTLKAMAYRTADRSEEEIGVVVTCRGEVVHFSKIAGADSMQVSLDASSWPLGVCRLTLYSKEGMVLSSRSLFHSNASFTAPKIEVFTDSLYGIPFMPEILNLRLTDQKGNPIRDRFCLSVRDIEEYGSGNTDNIMTNLLLSSDLRGYIQTPSWYMESDDDLHHRAMDLLTLVQGWERYEWRTMTGQDGWREQHRVEDSLTMNGWLLSYLSREKLPDVEVMSTLTPQDKSRAEQFEYTTDTTGYFGFDVSDFYGKARFSISLVKWNRRGKLKYPTLTRIKFERSDVPESRAMDIMEKDLSEHDWKSHNPAAVNDSDEDYSGIVDEDEGIVLDDVDIEARRRFIDYDTFRAWDVREEMEKELDKGEYTGDMRGWLLDKGYNFYNPIYFYVHNSTKVLDQKPFDDPYMIDMIDVKSVMVYDEPMPKYRFADLIPLEEEYQRNRLNYMWRNKLLDDRMLYRLVDVLIKEDNELLSYKDIRNLSKRETTVTGYSETVQFYSPSYPDGPVPGETDFRRTLYWNPNVITDSDGRARVQFYNNGYSSHFTVSGCGITASGTPYVLDADF